MFIIENLKIISAFGNSLWAILGVALLLILILLLKNHKQKALLVAFTLASYPVALLLKALFKMPRPEGAIITSIFPQSVYGFPSGHTLFYTVFWGYIFYLSHKLHDLNIYIRYALGTFALYFILFVGVSRVVLGVHFGVDVAGGYFFGFAFLAITLILDKILDQKLTPK